jgi:hypothetical protein
VFVYRSEKSVGNRPISVVAALVAGFDRVAAQPLLLLPIVLLDLFLWFGPHLAVPSIVQIASSSLTPPAGIDQGLAQQLAGIREAVTDVANRYNLFSALSTLPAGMPFNMIFGLLASLTVGLPSLLAMRLTSVSPLGAPVEWTVANLQSGILGWLGLSIIGIGLATVYLRAIAKGHSGGEEISPFRAAFPRLLVLAASGYVLTFTVLIGAALIGSVDGMLYIGMPLLFVGAVYLSFTTQGVIRYGLRIGRAMRESLRIVRWNFLGAMGLLLFSFFVVWTAATQVWSLPGEDTWYLLLAILGHAFVSTTLISASYAFYQGRREWMQAVAERILQQQMQGAQPPDESNTSQP